VQKLTTFLTFDHQAAQAVDFYTSVFKNSKVISVNKLEVDHPESPPVVLSAEFELEDQRFMALNGGPSFRFEQGFSIYIDCADQSEVDYFWEKLSEGGEQQPCGWLKDRFGVSWQVVPRRLGELMGDPDPVKSKRVIDAMLKMGKIEIAGLERAYAGG
jgi:predicted 3-demethylubiquinone-9 3-methyltransferase (glyoxalase superfamily)